MNVSVKKLKENAKLPTKGSEKAAAYDLYACLDEPATIRAETTVLIGTGLAMTPPPGYFGAIFARSGLAVKQGLRPANCVAVIDEDYTGEYLIPLYNDSSHFQIVEPGERIAQIVFLPYLDVTFQEVDKLEETDRGSGGFGSTGTM